MSNIPEDTDLTQKVVINNIWDKREHVDTMPKNRIHDVNISYCTNKGKAYADIRMYNNGIPTKHGVAIEYEKIDRVIAALLRIKERVDGCE